VVDEKGERPEVILPIEEYERLRIAGTLNSSLAGRKVLPQTPNCTRTGTSAMDFSVRV
jgi:hypothetical protein